MKRTIVIDFDGTIVDHMFPQIGEPKEGAIEAIKELRKHFHIIVSSCRNNHHVQANHPKCLDDLRIFLVKYGLEFCEVDSGEQGKPVGSVYIDDRGLRFENNWADIKKILMLNKDNL